MVTIDDFRQRALLKPWEPGDARSVWQWAEEEVSLSLRQTESPGPYSTLMTPYVREVLQCFRDERVSDLVLCWGTQTAKTLTSMVGAAWRIVNRPSPALWVMPNEDLAASFSETRWMPLVEDCAPLAAKRHPNQRKFTKLAQDFMQSTLHFVGSNSPANLASRPISFLVLDETDKYATHSKQGTEAGALHLAENRTKSFANPLRVKTSTPTVDDGTIWSEFLLTDQRYYFLPCPHCAKLFRFEWSGVRWDQAARGANGVWDLVRVRISARYECPHCAGEINDGHKSRMLRDGKWIATNDGADGGRRGYHLNSLYAPWKSCSFGALAVRFLQAQSDRSLLQDFMNSTLALPWVDQVERVRDEDVLQLRGKYSIGTIPVEPALVILTADPGEKETHWAVHALAPNGELFLVDYGKVIAITDLLQLLKEKQYVDCTGKLHGIHTGIVDSGYQTEIVYRVCNFSPWNQRLYPSRGVDAGGKPWNMSQVHGHPQLLLYVYSDFVLKSSYYLDRIAKRLPPLYHLPENVGQEFIAGISGQALVRLRGKGRAFRKLAFDHYGDCGKLAVLAWWVSADAISARYKTLVQGIPVQEETQAEPHLADMARSS